MRSIPVIGSYLSFFVFGGPFPGEAIIPRLYSVHILLLPAILVGLFTAHIGLVFVHKHTQYPGPGRTNDNVVGYPIMPVYAAKAGGFFFIVFGVIALIAALVTINPIWTYGPYDPSPVTAGSQPDWYMGFADGALRLLPGLLEFTAFGFTFSLQRHRSGAILLIPVMYGLIGAYPFLEALGHRRQAGAPPARPAAQRPDPHRPRRHGADLLRPAHVSPPATTSSRSSCTCRSTTSPTCCGSAFFVAPAARLLGHQADLPVPAAPRPRAGAARPRDRSHRPHRRGQVLRGARGARRARALAPGAARDAGAARSCGRPTTATASPPGGPQGAGAGQAVAASTSPTASTRRHPGRARRGPPRRCRTRGAGEAPAPTEWDR